MFFRHLLNLQIVKLEMLPTDEMTLSSNAITTDDWWKDAWSSFEAPFCLQSSDDQIYFSDKSKLRLRSMIWLRKLIVNNLGYCAREVSVGLDKLGNIAIKVERCQTRKSFSFKEKEEELWIYSSNVKNLD